MYCIMSVMGPAVLGSLGAHLGKFAICLEESMLNSTDL